MVMQRAPVAMGQNTRTRQEIERGILERRAYTIDVTNVTNGNTTLLTVPDERYFDVTDFGVCNIAGAQIAVTVYRVPSGGSAANGNKVYDAYPVQANDSGTLTNLIGSTLNPGDQIIAVTDNATGGNFTLSGLVFLGGSGVNQ